MTTSAKPAQYPGAAKRAILYLRVSTKEQAGRGGEAEGYSIPTQRLLGHQKAEALGAAVVEEFVDAGESARSADRPELQRMLAYIEAEQVDVLIVHKIDRLARNRMDDLLITMALEKAGVQLVSCSEQIDNKTPSGKLTHGLMALIAEWYSSNLSSEVRTKTLQKVRNGGTVGKAPVGYLNVRRVEAGRELRTVVVDPDRADHVRWAFSAYASGDYTVRQLTAALEARGLTTVATKQYPETALSVSKVHRMLRNRFYIGYFTWGGVEYESNQTPIIDRPVFDAVQDLLAARNVSGEKQRLHNHYLKGTILCGGCHSRLCITHTTNRWGTTYVYFFCLGRQQRRTTCLRKAVSVELIEEKVEQLWDAVHVSPEYSDLLDELIRDELAVYREQAERTRASATRRLQLLQGQRRKLLDAHYAGAIPIELL
jgi:DNA invertase Pin-like site-specific DNA recombinase